MRQPSVVLASAIGFHKRANCRKGDVCKTLAEICDSPVVVAVDELIMQGFAETICWKKIIRFFIFSLFFANISPILAIVNKLP